jgi:hypothetical protein
VKKLRSRLTYANVMSSIAVFLVLGGATAFAASQLGKNSVGSKQLRKNAVTSAKIKNNAVTGPKLQNGAVTDEKIKAGAVTGAKIQLSTLGTVPSASTANTAANLAGQQSFFIRLNGGESQTIATNGSVSLIATCDANLAGNDRVRILAQTTLGGAILDGIDNLSGPGGTGEFLEPSTPDEKREFAAFSDTTGDIDVGANIDQGYVLGPEGKMITANSEGIALGLNYGSTCLTAGIVNLIG